MGRSIKASSLREYLNDFKDDTGDKAQVGVLNCLSIIDYAHDGDMSNEDFSELDFRRSSFAGKNFNNTKFSKSHITRNLFFPQGHTARIKNASYSPCGNFIISASCNEVIIWCSHTGKVIIKHSYEENVVVGAHYSPCSEYIVFILGYFGCKEFEDGGANLVYEDFYLAKFWEQYLYFCVEKRNKVSDVKESGIIVNSRAFNLAKHARLAHSPCGKYVVSMTYDNMIKILDVETGETIKDFARQIKEEININYSTCGEFLLFVYEDKIELRNSIKGNIIYSKKNTSQKMETANCSPCGRYIVCAFIEERTYVIEVFDCKTGEIGCKIRVRYGYITNVSFSPCGNFIVSASRDGKISIHCRKSGKLIRIMHGAVGAFVTCPAEFSLCGSFILCIYERSIKIWKIIDIKKCTLMHTLTNHGDYIDSAFFSPCGKYVVSTSEKYIIVWSSETGRYIRKINNQDREQNACYSPCGNYIVSVSLRGIIIRSSQSGDFIDSSPIGESETFLHYLFGGRDFQTVSCDPKNEISGRSERIVTTLSGKIQIWSIITGNLLLEFGTSASDSMDAKFSPCGSFILSHGKSGNDSYVWCSKTGNQTSPNLGPSRISPKYIRKGKCIVTADSDGAIKILCADSYYPVCTLKVDGAYIYRVSFSACENYVILSFYDGTDNDDNVKICCSKTGEWLNVLFPMATQVLGAKLKDIKFDGLAEHEHLTDDDRFVLKQNGAIID